MKLFKHNYYSKMSDEALIELFKAKDEAAFGEIYIRYGHLVIGVSMKYLKNKMHAEDITMQIFEKIHAKINAHSITHFKSWLYMTTKNECLMFIRSQKKYSETNIIEQLQEEAYEDFDLSELKYELLEEKLKTLKADQRDCIERFYLKNESYQQISAAMNLTLMQVKSAVQNGKRNLKLKLEQHQAFQRD